MPEKRTAGDDRKVVVGQVRGIFGVQGWVKVQSYTEPPENILNYAPWWVDLHGQWCEIPLIAGRLHGKGIVVRVEGYAGPDAARELVGAEVAVSRGQLPPVSPGEYYWDDLTGMDVVNRDGMSLGRVDHLFATGANDVMVVKGERERLIPFLMDQVVITVDFERGVISVDWDAAF
jgi:16S rRNA processing protein RimM